MTSEELTTLNDVFGALNNDSNENANNYDIIIRNQTSGNAMKVPVATFKTVLYNYLTSASVAASLASVLGVGMIRQDITIQAGQEVYVACNIYGLMCIRDETHGRTAIYSLNNGSYAMQKINGQDFSTTKDAAGALNIYFNYSSQSGSVGLHIQNKYSSPVNVKYSIL